MAQKNEAAAHALPRRISMERARGIEPPSLAWEADILPMNYARVIADLSSLSWAAWFFKENFLSREKEEKTSRWRIIKAGYNIEVRSLRKGAGSMARKKRRRAPRRPSKFKRVMKIIGCVLLGIIFLGGAGTAGYFAAHH